MSYRCGRGTSLRWGRGFWKPEGSWRAGRLLVGDKTRETECLEYQEPKEGTAGGQEKPHGGFGLAWGAAGRPEGSLWQESSLLLLGTRTEGAGRWA